MREYIILTRLEPDALHDPADLRLISARIGRRIREELPGVKWLDSYALLNRHDFLDIFAAPGQDEALHLATIIETEARAQTEVLPAIAARHDHHDDLLRRNHLHPLDEVTEASKESYPASDAPAWIGRK